MLTEFVWLSAYFALVVVATVRLLVLRFREPEGDPGGAATGAEGNSAPAKAQKFPYFG